MLLCFFSEVGRDESNKEEGYHDDVFDLQPFLYYETQVRIPC